MLAAGDRDSSTARRALGTLCEIYWYPLYAYVRRTGATAEDARDLTQGFFADFVPRGGFQHLQQDRGRFRAFLLASLKHFLANDTARRLAQKRGGGLAPLSLSVEEAEGRYRHEPADTATPETLFERRWALTVIERVLADLREQWTRDHREAEFDELRACLLGTAPPGGYEAVAQRLETTAGAVKVAVHRLRRRFREHLRTHILETVADPAEVDDEIRYLVRSLDR